MGLQIGGFIALPSSIRAEFLFSLFCSEGFFYSPLNWYSYCIIVIRTLKGSNQYGGNCFYSPLFYLTFIKSYLLS